MRKAGRAGAIEEVAICDTMTREFTPNKAQGAVQKGLADGNHDAAAMLATFIRTSGNVLWQNPPRIATLRYVHL
ncbi:MAG: hypothetical protein WCD75_04910, partial [Rhodoplanes sp.]